MDIVEEEPRAVVKQLQVGPVLKAEFTRALACPHLP